MAEKTMINKELINTVPESKKYIKANVGFQWISLLANIVFIWTITSFAEKMYFKNYTNKDFVMVIAITALTIFVSVICTSMSSKMSFYASKEVKAQLRDKIFNKLLGLGASYKEQVNTSEVVQVTVEGTQQLESYFGAYLPQFFYSMMAPVTLFIVLAFVNLKAAFILIIAVPLIPISIALVQTWAKRLLSKYWGQYTALGDTFLENLQGLTTLKIYKTDELKNNEMNREAEKFRKITMKVLTMQLNSITIMDLVAYGGAAVGIIIAVKEFMAGNIRIGGTLMIILLSAEFFIPMRMLGSYFHIAMNGMAAWGKIQRILSLAEKNQEDKIRTGKEIFTDIVLENIGFSYDGSREIIQGANMNIHQGQYVGIVGESGCGKSTLAGILSGRNAGYRGNAFIGGFQLSEIMEEDLMKNITCVNHDSYLFKGTLRSNLLIACPEASEDMMLKVLERVNLLNFALHNGGLDMVIAERGGNLSGGQRQRLAMARALLHHSPVYIFDEATSNVDVESEEDIMREIKNLAKTKTVIVISHRLANVKDADKIYVMEKGTIVENGSHSQLIDMKGTYQRIWNVQQQLENVGRKASQ